MPVTVQMPGFQNHAAPIAGLADIVNTIGNLKKNSQAGDLAEAQLQQENLKNQALQAQTTQEQAYRKALSDPNSQETKGLKAGASALFQSFYDNDIIKKSADPNKADALAPLLSIINDPTSSGLQVQNTIANSPFTKDLTDIAGKKLQGISAVNSANIRAAPQNDRNMLSSNDQYSSQMNPFETTITSANRAMGIIQKIKKGDLKSTPTLANDLSSSLAMMFNNGKAATVSGQEHNLQGITSAAGDLATKWGYLDGQAINSMAPDQLDQLNKDITAARSEYGYARQSMFDSFKQGLPNADQAKLQNRFNQFTKSSVNSNLSKKEQSSAPQAPAKGSGPGGAMGFDEFMRTRGG